MSKKPKYVKRVIPGKQGKSIVMYGSPKRLDAGLEVFKKLTIWEAAQIMNLIEAACKQARVEQANAIREEIQEAVKQIEASLPKNPGRPKK